MDEEKYISSGKYRHFKGKEYDVFCVAKDNWGQEFVLYRAHYGELSFWLRPYHMFLEKVERNGERVSRFELVGERVKREEKVKELIELLKKEDISIENTEDGRKYCIINIDDKDEFVYIHPMKELCGSGYLTDYELARRMNIAMSVINGNIHIQKSAVEIKEEERLEIGSNDASTLKNWINPCSVDLQIASVGFLKTKRKTVDPRSIEYVLKAKDLWKVVKTYKSKQLGETFFKLRPGETVLTHTEEKIRIPSNCAGKVEIKNTYARLSLSITSADFCNPGYAGYFPLEITNHGKHTIVIHAKETMAQLMLVPLFGPVIEEYSSKATYKNDDGFDDGTPYFFWRERSIKKIRKEKGAQPLIVVYDYILKNVESEIKPPDVNGFKLRFEDNYLTFCQKRMHRQKYKNADTGLPNIYKLICDYDKREQWLKRLTSIKWISAIGAILSFVGSIFVEMLPLYLEGKVDISLPPMWILVLFGIISAIIAGCLSFYAPKTFCTFEKCDIKKMLQKLEIK